ncbi:uncharacterized protein LOC128156199 [Crassostrea angulata]|uniref:uncharacterized protein LOC128156199 n=1 Tax=Magallana angulata TaxID=2784310 RepID=UPI0022B10385|nr:uncharacterized protein LOC128156199 [Crassostrea angulata]
MESRGNPAPNVSGLSAYPSKGGFIPLGTLDPTTIGQLQPHLARRQDQPRTPPPLVRTFPGQDQPRQDQPRRPLAPVLGRATPDILDILGPAPKHPPAPEHVIVLDSPSSPDPSPPSSPVNTPPKKELAPSPPVSSSRTICSDRRISPSATSTIALRATSTITLFNVISFIFIFKLELDDGKRWYFTSPFTASEVSVARCDA